MHRPKTREGRSWTDRERLRGEARGRLGNPCLHGLVGSNLTPSVPTATGFSAIPPGTRFFGIVLWLENAAASKAFNNGVLEPGRNARIFARPDEDPGVVVFLGEPPVLTASM